MTARQVETARRLSCTLLRFSIFQRGIENRGFTQNETFVRRGKVHFKLFTWSLDPLAFDPFY